MNQSLETVIKSLLVVFSMLFATGTLVWPTETATVNTISAALATALAVAIDAYSTYRLRKQGIVSTNPVVNVAAPGSPAELAAAEKKADAPSQKTPERKST